MKRPGIGLNARDRANQDTLNKQGPWWGEVYPTLAPDAVELAKTANYTFTTADFGKWMTNEGDAGTQTLTLPLITTAMIGKVFGVKAMAAQEILVSPNAADAIFLHGDGVLDKDVVVTGAISEFVIIYCHSLTKWYVTQANGVITKEA